MNMPKSSTLRKAAGETFSSLIQAGEYIIHSDCRQFGNGSSCMLPPIFIAKYTEGIDPDINAVPKSVTANPEKYRGVVTGQAGENQEKLLFDLITKAATVTPCPTFLGFHGLKYNERKWNALANDYPMNISQIESVMKKYNDGEHDFLIYVKCQGFLMIEVKNSTSHDNLAVASRQLLRFQEVLNLLIQLVNPQAFVPCIKVVSVPSCKDESPWKINDEYHLYKTDHIEFSKYFNLLCKELHHASMNQQTFTDNEFESLSYLLTAWWSAKSFKGSLRSTDLNEANRNKLLVAVDKQVTEQHLSSVAASVKEKDRKHPLNSVLYNPPKSLFRSIPDVNLIFLNQEQNALYSTLRRGVVKGCAGSGKTLMMLIKIIELVQVVKTDKQILLVAPHPHNLRCREFLNENDINLVEVASLADGEAANVLLISSESFFDKDNLEFHCSIVQSHNFHIFVDDFHSVTSIKSSFFGYRGILTAKMFEIPEIKQRKELLMKVFLPLLNTAATELFWILHDPFQSKLSGAVDLIEKYNADHPSAKLPVVLMNTCLRNTTEIIDTISYYHRVSLHRIATLKKSINNGDRLSSNLTPVAGHNIHGPLVQFHRVHTDIDDDSVMRVLIEKYLPDCINNIRAENKSTNVIMLSDIAIFFDNITLGKTTKETLAKVGISYQSVENLILTKNTEAVIIDDFFNINSGEWPIVILLRSARAFTNRSWYNEYYAICSRARSQLIIFHRAVLNRSIFNALSRRVMKMLYGIGDEKLPVADFIAEWHYYDADRSSFLLTSYLLGTTWEVCKRSVKKE